MLLGFFFTAFMGVSGCLGRPVSESRTVQLSTGDYEPVQAACSLHLANLATKVSRFVPVGLILCPPNRFCSADCHDSLGDVPFNHRLSVQLQVQAVRIVKRGIDKRVQYRYNTPPISQHF